MNDPWIPTLRYKALWLRSLIDPIFASDTAAPGTPEGATSATSPSTGHCAVVAILVDKLWENCQFVSSKVEWPVGSGTFMSHWFNRLVENGVEYDIDLTGDQFGREPVQVGPKGTLYENTVIRDEASLNEETKARASLFQTRLSKTRRLDGEEGIEGIEVREVSPNTRGTRNLDQIDDPDILE